jgi:hypothetical protein
VGAFTAKWGLWVRKLDGKSVAIFSRLKNFVEENLVEPYDTLIDQFIKVHLVNLKSRFSTYSPEAVSDKYRTFTIRRNLVKP